MSDDTKKMPKVGRRDTIKLATAVTALGAGLGVVLDADDAQALTGDIIKLRAPELGNLVLKFYKLEADGKTSTLLDTVDVGALSLKFAKGGAYSLKMYNHKSDAPVLIGEQAVSVEAVNVKLAPPQIQAPPAIKR